MRVAALTSMVSSDDGVLRLERISQRLYFSSVGWAFMPDWARFFVDLGATVASIDTHSPRVVVSVATPTRAYAAALCATGVIHQRIGTPVEADSDTHVAFLRTLAPRTTVTFKRGARGTRRQTGWFMGCVIQGGKEYLEIHDTDDGRVLIPVARAHAVQLSKRILQSLPTRATLRSVRPKEGLLAGVLTPTEIVEFLRHDRLDCVIVGNESLLRAEIQETPFAIRIGGSDMIDGTLRDVLRARCLLGEGECYRSEIVSATGKLPRWMETATPHVVIFDGATSFLRWSSTWPYSHWIVILDRTEHLFDDAVAELNRAYQTRLGDRRVLPLPLAPNYIECASFLARQSRS